MNISGLSLDQTPPLSVPAPYFAAAPLFAAAAGLMLVFTPGLLASRWLPETLATTHLLTLGFLALAMMGALQQLLPVLAGAPVPRARFTSLFVYIPFVAGVVLLALGLGTGEVRSTRAASLLLAASLLSFLGVAAWSLAWARARSATVIGMRIALVALLITVGLGLHLLAGHGWGMPLVRGLTDFHAAWGLIGWVALLVMGVAYQVVPMFQVTPDYPPVLVKYLIPALFLLVLAWSAIAWLWPDFAPVAAGAVAGGLAVFGTATLWIQYRRRRRLPDVTLDFWRTGMGSLLLVVLVWGVTASLHRHPPEILLGILFIMGFGVSVVSGMLYKILPFLIWLHLNNKLFMVAGLRGRVPNMKQVISEARARIQFRLHIVALIFLAGAAVTGGELMARVAGALFASSSGLLAINLFSALSLYRRLLRETGEALKRGVA